ncbi:MAG: hypothetical protein H6648_09895 [Caldilineae bacterium]|nr:hypothetical protein [Chloroflexota bacterium]MCB9177461.1 hypothetical protein [Caldilineae bacterium]
MRKNAPALVSMIGLWLAPVMLLPGPASARSAASLRVEHDRLAYRFAESLEFELAASADQSIDDIILRYTIGSEAPRNRRIPEFEPGKRVVARHQEDLVRGQIPPASEIRWWWSLELADGSQVETEPQSLNYLDQRFDWELLDAPDLRVWWYDADPDFARSVQASAREALARLQALYGSEPGRRIDIVTFQSQADLRPALIDRGDTYESRLATLGARVADDILVLDAGTRSDEREEVLAHELSHIVLNLHLEEPYIDAPLWLDEGLAMYVEGPLDAEERAGLESAIRNDSLMSVRSLTSFPGDASLVILAYAESQDLISFLIESHGREALRELLDGIGSGEETPDEALERVYGYDQLALYQAYRAARGLPPALAPKADAATTRRGPALEDRGDRSALPLPCSGAGLLLIGTLALAIRHWLLID